MSSFFLWLEVLAFCGDLGGGTASSVRVPLAVPALGGCVGWCGLGVSGALRWFWHGRRVLVVASTLRSPDPSCPPQRYPVHPSPLPSPNEPLAVLGTVAVIGTSLASYICSIFFCWD